MGSLDRIILIRPVLSQDSIHVFLIRLGAFNPSSLYIDLSEDEQSRADRLKVPGKRVQFIIARAVLRRLLANCLNRDLADICFSYAKNGRPCVDNTLQGSAIEFNVSHSGNFVLIALSLENRLGVDIEKISPDIDYPALASRFFSQAENTQLATFKGDERRRAFYRAWVRKESFIKAIGAGIGYGLDQFSVSLQENAASSRVVSDDQSDKGWHFYELVKPEGYETSLSVRHPALEIVLSQLI